MKAKQEIMALTFGELIMAVHDALGKRRASGIIRLAIEARLIVFQGRSRPTISQRERERGRDVRLL